MGSGTSGPADGAGSPCSLPPFRSPPTPAPKRRPGTTGNECLVETSHSPKQYRCKRVDQPPRRPPFGKTAFLGAGCGANDTPAPSGQLFLPGMDIIDYIFIRFDGVLPPEAPAARESFVNQLTVLRSRPETSRRHATGVQARQPPSLRHIYRGAPRPAPAPDGAGIRAARRRLAARTELWPHRRPAPWFGRHSRRWRRPFASSGLTAAPPGRDGLLRAGAIPLFTALPPRPATRGGRWRRLRNQPGCFRRLRGPPPACRAALRPDAVSLASVAATLTDRPGAAPPGRSRRVFPADG